MGFTQAHPKYKNNTVEVASMVPSMNKSSGGTPEPVSIMGISHSGVLFLVEDALWTEDQPIGWDI